MEQLITVNLVRKFIEDGQGDADYILWCLDKYAVDEGYFDNEDE